MSKIYRPQVNFYIDDDICFCADSDRCKRTDCFRHMVNHRRPETGPDIFTCSKLMWTELCPMIKEGEN